MTHLFQFFMVLLFCTSIAPGGAFIGRMVHHHHHHSSSSSSTPSLYQKRGNKNPQGPAQLPACYSLNGNFKRSAALLSSIHHPESSNSHHDFSLVVLQQPEEEKQQQERSSGNPFREASVLIYAVNALLLAVIVMNAAMSAGTMTVVDHQSGFGADPIGATTTRQEIRIGQQHKRWPATSSSFTTFTRAPSSWGDDTSAGVFFF